MVNYNRIFGFQTFVTLDVYDLLGMTPTPGRAGGSTSTT